MAKLEALLFDVDGTLADTEDLHRACFNRAFAAAGLDWQWDRALYAELLAVTGGKERIRHFLQTCRPDFPLPVDADQWIAGLHADKTRYYTGALAGGELPLRPGVLRLLHEARAAGLRMAIATTTTPANVTALLEHSVDPAAHTWFELIAAGSVVPAKKPAPDIYQYTLQQMGLSGGQCLALEDSANGLASALGAGIATVITVNPYTAAQSFEGALLVTDSMGEPDQPFEVLAGDAGDATCLDLALLRKLHAGG